MSAEYIGPMFVGPCRFRFRSRGIRLALRCLWNAIRGFELAGYDYGPPTDEPTVPRGHFGP